MKQYVILFSTGYYSKQQENNVTASLFDAKPFKRLKRARAKATKLVQEYENKKPNSIFLGIFELEQKKVVHLSCGKKYTL